MVTIIGETRVLYYYGQKYVFKKVGPKQWECISGNPIIPEAVKEDLK